MCDRLKQDQDGEQGKPDRDLIFRVPEGSQVPSDKVLAETAEFCDRVGRLCFVALRADPTVSGLMGVLAASGNTVTVEFLPDSTITVAIRKNC